MATQLDALRAYVASRPAASAPAPARGARRDARDAREPGPAMFVVGSGKGGAGTSITAAMLALALAASGARTLLVDADEQVGAQRLLLGVPTADGARGIGDLRAAAAPTRCSCR
jgi:Mrp family chromosome partitioning ATPase